MLLGRSGQEFLEAYRSGDIVEDARRPQIPQLLMLLPFAEASH